MEEGWPEELLVSLVSHSTSFIFLFDYWMLCAHIAVGIRHGLERVRNLLWTWRQKEKWCIYNRRRVAVQHQHRRSWWSSLLVLRCWYCCATLSFSLCRDVLFPFSLQEQSKLWSLPKLLLLLPSTREIKQKEKWTKGWLREKTR